MPRIKHTRVLAVVVRLATGLLLAGFLAACRGDELTADEIVANSREHFEASRSYEALTTSFQFPDINEPSSTESLQIERPGNTRYLSADGSPRVTAIGSTAYRPSES